MSNLYESKIKLQSDHRNHKNNQSKKTKFFKKKAFILFPNEMRVCSVKGRGDQHVPGPVEVEAAHPGWALVFAGRHQVSEQWAHIHSLV